MANKIYPANDAAFAIWLANLINKAVEHKSKLKLPDELIPALQAKLDSFDTNLALKQQKKEESVAQTALVKTQRKDLNREIGLLNGAVKSIGDLAPNIIEELGLNVNESHAGSPAIFNPSDLVATGTSDGTNTLKFKRNGNRPNTTFLIEAKIGDSGNWVIIDAVTNLTYKHKNQTPGVKIQYRVKAKRGDLESGYSNTAVVYS